MSAFPAPDRTGLILVSSDADGGLTARQADSPDLPCTVDPPFSVVVAALAGCAEPPAIRLLLAGQPPLDGRFSS